MNTLRNFLHLALFVMFQPRPPDQDMAHGSLWILPLAALIAIVAYQHQTVRKPGITQ